MTKVTLDMDTFKALASDTRLDILKTLDGKKMSLKDISAETKLNKATLHEHLVKLNEAGLVKRKEREGHKWVTYKLTWKGECLLHPENTRIVVMFSTTFMALAVGIIQMIWYVKGTVVNLGYKIFSYGNEAVMASDADVFRVYYQDNVFNNFSNGRLPPQLEFFNNILTKSDSHLVNTEFIPLDKNLSWIESSMDSGGSIYDMAGGLEDEGTRLVVDESQGVMYALSQNPLFLYIAVACFIVFTLMLCFSLWRYWENKTPKI
jgi:DNA-binding transcriptional ArsR family regulator